MKTIDHGKAVVIGCGFVGSATAFALMQSGLFQELVLIDRAENKAEGEALDIAHGVPFARPVRVYAGSYADVSDAAIAIITAGANQAPGETRLDLAGKNTAIMTSVVRELVSSGFGGIMLVVANPVDVLTYAAVKISGYPASRVIGSGTVLDTARLKSELGRHLGVDSRSVHAFIVGEHGDSEIVAWSSANVSGIPINAFCEMRGYFNHEAAMREIADRVRCSAYEIIEKKRATYYGIAMSVRRICEAIVRDEKSILPLSFAGDDFGGVALSMPVIVGEHGVETRVPLSLNAGEREALDRSAAELREVIGKLGL